MTKLQLAKKIESHHLYDPQAPGVHSKRYHKYSRDAEIKILMKMSKPELQELYNESYDADGRELTMNEMAMYY